MDTPMAMTTNLTKDEEGESIDNKKYRGQGVDVMCFADSDLGRCMVDRKSTSGVCAFVGLALTSWFSKK
ncbi:hypothetical protein L1987_01997 [Smallanthus sonchifolius]|uniref:Uncharacterized protein n=1 Tax=Smallanthus sonchifolius TaxID=185202 RepID=A0ACB9K6P0_9ASTR|nr:hypothetical protein L1987_01997 [Smallanthus sonchifolius]